MDYTILNNTELYDKLLAVLSKHRDEPGVVEAIEYLKAAKTNYIRRPTPYLASIDKMMNCLVLVIYELVRQPPGEELSLELKSVVRGYVTGIFEAGAKMSRLAHEYEASGGKLLSQDEILQEVDERRGTSER